MRTRIALAAIIPVALITVSTLTQAATMQSARAVTTSSPGTKSSTAIVMPPNQLAAYRGLTSGAPLPARSSLLFDLNAALFSHNPTHATGAATSASPVTTPAPTATSTTTQAATPTAADTVTPDQRAAWERVAMCEEGGNWASNGGGFSGGLGISRANWSAFGGREFAPDGAMATEDEQIMVAERIEASPPDQYGCRGW
jgi:hypothetical protein